MDIKEKKMLQHYKNIIENRCFDEYDILGFLIFIRWHLGNNQKYIRDLRQRLIIKVKQKVMERKSRIIMGLIILFGLGSGKNLV